MSEIELKFGVPESRLGAVEERLRQLGARRETLESHYWDSADRRLAKAGLSLRARKSAGRWEQTLKAAGANPAERLEETAARPGRWQAGGPAPELRIFAGSAAAKLAEAALSGDRGRPAPLRPVHTSLIVRGAARIDIAGAAIELALDRGTIVAGHRSMSICEFEIELKRGDPAALIDVARASVDAHGMWLSTISKAARGDRLAASADSGEAVRAKPPHVARTADGETLFRAIVRSCLDQVLANASLLAAGGPIDDDVVHQLRIGLRRLRTAVRELGVWRGALATAWEAATTEIFHALGAYRDRRTVADSIERELIAAGAPAPRLRAAGSRQDELDPVRRVRSAAFQHALLDLLAFVVATAAAPPAPHGPERAIEARKRTLADRLDRLHAHLRRDVRRFERYSELERHGVRKRLKRLRYLSELVAPLYRHGRVKSFLRELKPAQDALGRYMDLVVACRLARGVLDAGDPRAWFNIGWLQAQQPGAVERCAGSLGRAASARPYWRGAAR